MRGAGAGTTAWSGAHGFSAAARGLARAVIGTLAAAALVACGSQAPSPTLTRLRSEATHICALADRQTDAIRTPASPTGGAAFLRAGLAVLAPELSQLRSLQSPSDTATVYQAAVAAFSEEVRAIRQTLSALGDGLDPATAMRDLRRRLVPLESAQDGAWRALQVPACVAS